MKHKKPRNVSKGWKRKMDGNIPEGWKSSDEVNSRKENIEEVWGRLRGNFLLLKDGKEGGVPQSTKRLESNTNIDDQKALLRKNRKYRC